jgi:hypothetical protein
MRTALLATIAMVLTACGPAPDSTPAEESAAAPERQLALICEAFAHVSYEALSSAYGAENLSEQTLPGPEGETYTATVLYPNDTARRLELVWRDDTRAAPASVAVSGEGSLWRGPHNIAIGDDVARVETANGRAFTLWGFGWDYGGWVSNWDGGAFAPAQNCSVSVRFQPSADATTAQGDSGFSSADAAVRAANPRVSQFGLTFGE